MAALLDQLAQLSAKSRFAARGLPRLIAIAEEGRQGAFEDLVGRLPQETWVIFRNYNLHGPSRMRAARRACAACKDLRIPFLVARDPELAESIDADGMHVPEYLIGSVGEFREAKPHWLFTSACHSTDALSKAAAVGIHAALFSPIFPTRSHPDANVLGAAALRDAVDAHPDLAIYALGGVNVDTMHLLVETGAAGIAGIDLLTEL